MRKGGQMMAAFFNRKKMKISLTIKAIIRWEQMRGKSFSLMDYSDQEDVETLLYTTTICNNVDKMYTFNVFRKTLVNKKLVKEMVFSLERETVVLSQFQKSEDVTVSDTAEGTPGKISEIVSTLILSGLDAHYALNEMELCDLPLYLEAYERKRKEEMESSRMWTYFTMLPHIDAKKMKNGARDLIVFPWEEEEMRKEAERAIREDAGRFDEFMKTKKADYYGR